MIDVLLIIPAVLFMTALFMRNVQPQEYEPAHSAQQIVLWYASQPRIGLWLLLMSLPAAALAIGGTIVVRKWHTDVALRKATRAVASMARSHLTTLILAATSLTAAGVLGIVALHVLTD